MAHALLSPSAAERWLTCTPSARFEEPLPESSGDAAKEGTAAHKVAETLLRQYTGQMSETESQIALASEDVQEYLTPEMLDHADDYAVYVLEQLSRAKAQTPDAMLTIEQRIDITKYVEGGFGTGDAVIVADSTLEVIDFKYGKGVVVCAEWNKQLMLYALGALAEYSFLWDIQLLRLTIYQPRLANISSWEISAQELLAWAENDLRPKATRAYAGEGDFVPSVHCRFCKAKTQCKALAEDNMELAKYEFRASNLLSDEEIADILTRASPLTTWLDAIKGYALLEATENCKQWPGYKLVEGKSNRTYSNDKEVSDKLIAEGYAEDKIYKKELLGITAMEKLLTKKVFVQKLNSLIIKPQGRPTLVPISDPRPEIGSSDSAIKDFSN